MSQATDLINLKEKIDKAKVKMNKLEGEREGLYKTLKKDYGVTSLTKAKALLEKKEKEIAKNQKILDKQVEVLEEKYEW
jgi:hypothetical protein